MKGRTEIPRDLSGQASLVPSNQIICTDCLPSFTLVTLIPSDLMTMLRVSSILGLFPSSKQA